MNNMTSPARPQVVLVREGQEGHGCLVQTLWFLVFGWWMSQLAVVVGYLLVATVLLMPLGFALLNRVPYLATLRRAARVTNASVQEDGAVVVERSDKPQRPFWQRALYFLVIGWWFALIVLELGWLLTATVLLAPVGLALMGWFPTAITLRR